jgi:hypothetical protein
MVTIQIQLEKETIGINALKSKIKSKNNFKYHSETSFNNQIDQHNSCSNIHHKSFHGTKEKSKKWILSSEKLLEDYFHSQISQTTLFTKKKSNSAIWKILDKFKFKNLSYVQIHKIKLCSKLHKHK